MVENGLQAKANGDHVVLSVDDCSETWNPDAVLLQPIEMLNWMKEPTVRLTEGMRETKA